MEGEGSMTILPYLFAAIIACNVAVLMIATRNAALREKAKAAAPNCVDLARYRYYRRLNEVV